LTVLPEDRMPGGPLRLGRHGNGNGNGGQFHVLRDDLSDRIFQSDIAPN